MISQGLIEEVKPERVRDKRTTTYYEITQKGENIIKYFNRAKEFIELEEITKIR
jgi:predicted transcriptional regulator